MDDDDLDLRSLNDDDIMEMGEDGAGLETEWNALSEGNVENADTPVGLTVYIDAQNQTGLVPKDEVRSSNQGPTVVVGVAAAVDSNNKTGATTTTTTTTVPQHVVHIGLETINKATKNSGNKNNSINVSISSNSNNNKQAIRRRVCSYPQCQKRVVQGGLCISHGAKRKTCKSVGCNRPVKMAGLCSAHGPARKRCKTEGCDNVAVKAGLCIAHGARRQVQQQGLQGGQEAAGQATRLRKQIRLDNVQIVENQVLVVPSSATASAAVVVPCPNRKASSDPSIAVAGTGFCQPVGTRDKWMSLPESSPDSVASSSATTTWGGTTTTTKPPTHRRGESVTLKMPIDEILMSDGESSSASETEMEAKPNHVRDLSLVLEMPAEIFQGLLVDENNNNNKATAVEDKTDGNNKDGGPNDQSKPIHERDLSIFLDMSMDFLQRLLDDYDVEQCERAMDTMAV